MLHCILKSPSHCVFVCEDFSGEIVGYAVIMISGQLCSLKSLQVTDLAIQPNPSLSKIAQSKILISLVKAIEQFAKDKGAITTSVVQTTGFDISKFLLKRGYKISDITFVRKVG